jgi:hypothetical protein
MAGPAYYHAVVNIALNEDWVVQYQYATPTTDTFVGIDLTGSKLKLEIRKQQADHEAIVSCFSPDDGIVFTDIAHGAFTITISREKTWRLSPGSYFVDFVRLMPNGLQERIWEGSATVEQGTTR